MKINQLLLTHVGVFAVGVSIALVAKRGSNDSQGNSDSAITGRNRSSLESSRAADSSVKERERREAALRTGSSKQAAFQKIANISKMSDPMERQAALMELINRLGPEEFAAVAEEYKKLEHYNESEDEFNMILRGWAKADPLGALDYAGQQENAARETSVVLAAWAGKDAAAAERWALEHHQGDGPNPYMASVIQGIASYDLARATQLAEAMPRSRERGDAVNAITRALMVQGEEAAMAYPSSIKDLALQAGFVDAIARRIASKDADKAASWLTTFSDAEVQKRAAKTVGEALAQENTSTAMTWLTQLEPEARAEAASGIIPVMSAQDLPATAKWVSSLSGTPNYDQIVGAFVPSFGDREPEQAAAWIQQISDPQQQTRLYHRTLGGWARRDAAAVKNWIANNTVPESVTRRFNR